MHKVVILSYMKSLSLATPHMIIMVGIPGSGKSFFAQQFSETFHAPLVSSELIATLASSSLAAAKLAKHQIDELLKTHQSIIIDGLGASRTERSELAKYAHGAGYEPLYVWVQTDLDTAKQRVIKDKNRSPAQRSTESYDAVIKHFAEPTASERAIVISGKHTYATQARIVLKKLSGPRAETSTHDIPTARPAAAGPNRNTHTITIR